MKLTDLVRQHGFTPSDLGQIKDAKLYERDSGNAVSELLCVQKIGNIMRVSRIAIQVLPGLMLPLGNPVDKLIDKNKLESYLNLTLAPAGDTMKEVLF